MKLNENYRLVSNSNNWILQFEEERTKKKTGEKYLAKDEWYFSEPHQALERFLSETLKGKETAEEFLAEIYRAKHLIAGIKWK